MNQSKRNLTGPPMYFRFARLIIGYILFYVPSHGVFGNMAKMNRVIGLLLIGWALWDLFYYLFRSQQFVEELKEQGHLTRYRIGFWVGVLGLFHLVYSYWS
jgi:hypothetical protein